MITWDLLELTLHPFWPDISGSEAGSAVDNELAGYVINHLHRYAVREKFKPINKFVTQPTPNKSIVKTATSIEEAEAIHFVRVHSILKLGQEEEGLLRSYPLYPVSWVVVGGGVAAHYKHKCALDIEQNSPAQV